MVTESVINLLNSHAEWENFMNYKKEQGQPNNTKIKDLESYVQNREYEKVIDWVWELDNLPIPKKNQISKIKNQKKRIVYTYPREINYLMKYITYLLMRKYDHLFAPNLYSFRSSTGVKKAIRYLKRKRTLPALYSYKADISNYFNSVDVSILLSKLEVILKEDKEIYRFIKHVLENPKVEWENQIISEKKGIMAGCPIASFLANVYLMDLDILFYNKGCMYLRYSDDLIVFAENRQELNEYVQLIKTYFGKMHLKINPQKEVFREPGEVWDFLGIEYKDGRFDISHVAKEKMKGKMRRKMKALLRWKHRKEVSNEIATRIFIKKLNKKLFENPIVSELTWARWYFPMIDTTAGLEEIDHYMQDCIRYLATERRTKRRYDFQYEDMKRLGYRSLVAEYYKLS